MPTVSVEQLKTRVARLKQQLAERSDSLEGSELRALKKRLRRLQRKHRRYAAEQAKNAAPAPDAPAAKPADATVKASEEAPAD